MEKRRKENFYENALGFLESCQWQKYMIFLDCVHDNKNLHIMCNNILLGSCSSTLIPIMWYIKVKNSAWTYYFAWTDGKKGSRG